MMFKKFTEALGNHIVLWFCLAIALAYAIGWLK
jgi:hypothetical protein